VAGRHRLQAHEPALEGRRYRPGGVRRHGSIVAR
jgi:hypothetical protein